MKHLFLLAVLAGSTSFAAQARDLNFGNKAIDGDKDTVRLSIRMDADATRIRFAPEYGETFCSHMRNDLCNKDVTLIEVSAKPAVCTVDGDLVHCLVILDGKTVATLKDGSLLDLPGTETLVQITSLTRLQEGRDGKIGRVTKQQLTFEVWGDRADGFDPLVKSLRGGGMFSGLGADTEPVNSSLF